jgi:DNA modification methylase
MYLEQEKLDVKSKKRSNLFNWRGQFTPEFVEYILSSFTHKGDRVFDPFVGSGTVLQESARLGLQADGFEINPSAYAMSRFFSFCNLTQEQRSDLSHSLEIKLLAELNKLNGARIYIDDLDYRKAYKNLLTFATNFASLLHSKEERILFLNMLFYSEKDKKLTVQDSLLKSFYQLNNSFKNLPYSNASIRTHLNDARKSGDVLRESIDLILTSPPYINVFNYHQNYRAIIESFHFDILKVAQSELGSNRKNRSNRFKTVIQYCLDIESAIRSFWQVLKPDAKMIMVLGRESNVRGVPFYNGQLVVEIIDNLKGFSNVEKLQRQFVNKFGLTITEDIILVKKAHKISDISNGRDIAIAHLKRSLVNSDSGVVQDLKEAILSSETIAESPIFDYNQVLTK